MAIKNLISGTVILLFCGLGFLSTSKLEEVGSHVVYGPSFFPNTLMLILCAGAAILIVKGAISYYRSNERGAVNKRMDPGYVLKVGLFWLFIAFYIILFNYTGFIVSTVVFLISSQILYGRRRAAHVVFVSVVGACITYLILAKLFEVPLPLILPG